jgi:tetratricopeptide (TPR) repeat protein
VLNQVLADPEVFTPQAPEYADALFLLAEVLRERAQPERAITVLEEALQRYPHDPRVWSARFLQADCHRLSGLALKSEAAQAPVERMESLRQESVNRLRRAADLFRGVIDELESRPAEELSPEERQRLRHARFHEADCFFEVQDYRSALKLYEEAAGSFRESPSALAAYVQMINCHVFLGQPAEARAALARAMVLVNALPSTAFEDEVTSQSREDWKRYFDWLGAAELF